VKAKITAIRELFEEANILLAKSKKTHQFIHTNSLGEWRKKVIQNNQDFLKMIQTLDLFIDLSCLYVLLSI
jgi:8-oxo-dGTP pyrophosphatase MutT (NUDIX family)